MTHHMSLAKFLEEANTRIVFIWTELGCNLNLDVHQMQDNIFESMQIGVPVLMSSNLIV